MATNAPVEITPAEDWKQVIAAGNQGALVQNIGATVCMYAEAASQPASTFEGHTLDSKDVVYVVGTQIAWVKALNGYTAKVSVTTTA